MRARLDTARPAAGVLVDAAWTVAPVLSDAAPSSPAPAPQPAPPQDLDPAIAFAPDLGQLPTSSIGRIEDDPSVRTAFARRVPNPRIALWSGAVLALLALLLTGLYEFRHERQIARVLDVLGISNGRGAGGSAAVSVGPPDPVTPGIAANAGAETPMATEPTVADSPADATAPESPPRATDTGTATQMPTEPTATDSTSGATAPDVPASATIGANAGAAVTAAPATVAQPPASTLPQPRAAQQHASPAPANPREACGARTQFSLYRCMQMQCSERRWASHAQCERLRTTDSVN
jgi:hypothetical protein